MDRSEKTTLAITGPTAQPSSHPSPGPLRTLHPDNYTWASPIVITCEHISLQCCNIPNLLDHDLLSKQPEHIIVVYSRWGGKWRGEGTLEKPDEREKKGEEERKGKSVWRSRERSLGDSCLSAARTR